MKDTKLILNHPMVKVVEKDNAYILSIRMRDGRYAVQQPYPADQRGIIGALTLALDVLAGKVLLVSVEAPVKGEEHVKLPGMLSLDSGE